MFKRNVIKLHWELGKNIKIKLHIEQKPIHIKADSNKIEQIFQNLISNAVKFSPEESKIDVTLENKKDKVCVKVKDRCKRIAKKDQDKVFISFTSISTKGTAGEKGTGVGMSIVKRIIDSHKGEIWLESELG